MASNDSESPVGMIRVAARETRYLRRMLLGAAVALVGLALAGTLVLGVWNPSGAAGAPLSGGSTPTSPVSWVFYLVLGASVTLLLGGLMSLLRLWRSHAQLNP